MSLDIRAETLYKKSNVRQVKVIIDEIYKTIATRVLEAHHSGSAEIYYELPETFEAGNLEPKDIQLMVYSRLIEKIEENDLKVGPIRRKNGTSVLHIRWPSVLDPTEQARMKKIIVGHLEADNTN